MAIGLAGAIGGFAQGAAQGLKLRSDLDDADQRRQLAKDTAAREERKLKIDEERNIRDAERFEEERQQIEARRELNQKLQQVNQDAINGTNGFENFGYVAPQQQGGIAAPNQQPQQNPFKATADGLYRNQRAADQLLAERRAQVLEEHYARLGQADKIPMARYQMMDMYDKNVERKVKTALSAAAIGAPGAMTSMAEVYKYFNDGAEINPNSGAWDAKTKSWKGVEFKDAKGNVTKSDITQEQILGLAKQDASALAMFNVEQAWKEKEYKLKETDVESSAGYRKGMVDIGRQNAATNERYRRDRIEVDRDTMKTNAAIRGRAEQMAGEEKAQKYFRNSFGVTDFQFKTEKEIEDLFPEQKREYAAARQKAVVARSRAELANTLWDLNDRKYSPSIVTNALPVIESRVRSGKGADGIDDATGLPFININGRRFIVPRD